MLVQQLKCELQEAQFVTVTDTPYPELVQAARDIGATMYQRRFGDPMPIAPTAKRE